MRRLLLCALLLLPACGDDGTGRPRPDAGDLGTPDADPGDAVTPDDTTGDAAPDDAGADDADDAALDDLGDTSPSDVVDASGDAGDAGDTAPNDDADTSADADAGPIELPPEITGEAAFDLVNSFVGTGGTVFGYSGLSPAAQVPNGLVKVGPDTTNAGSHLPQQHFSGYNALDPHVRGFSHLRLIGTGAADLGNLRVLPLAELPDAPQPGRVWTTMGRGNEQARPGWYQARLPDERITAEMSATDFAAIHHYTRDDDGPMHVLFDPITGVSDAVPEFSRVERTADGFRGELRWRGGFTGRKRPFTVWYVASFDPAPDRFVATSPDGWTDADAAEGNDTLTAASFDNVREVRLRFAISLVEPDSADAHLDDLDGRDLDDLASEARDRWIDKLDRIRIRGGTPDQQTIFYTALHNAWRMPSRLSELDGRFRGLDGEIDTWDDGIYYSDLSLWDSFRTTHPLYTWIDPELQRDCLRSLLHMTPRNGGRVPRWPAMLSDTGSMLGNPAAMTFAESALKGIDGVDWQEAYDALYAMEFGALEGGPIGREVVEDWVRLGYMPSDLVDESVSLTCEYAWTDDALVRLARFLDIDDAGPAEAGRSAWRNLLHPQTGFLYPRRSDGTFERPASQTTVYMRDGAYTEGSPWHWRFVAPADAPALAEALGGPDKLREQLDIAFERSSLQRDRRISTALPDPYYWHGNQVALVTPWLYHVTDRPERSAFWVDRILRHAYTAGDDGLPGNDDGGTLSSWYVLAATGLFPIAGTDIHVIGRPLFPELSLRTATGTLRIVAHHAPPAGDPQQVFIDDTAVDATWVPFQRLTGDTVVEFTPPGTRRLVRSGRAARACIDDPGCHAPIVVAHRGLHTGVPENTLAALRATAEAGIPFVEIDVQVTRDGVPVLMHDGTVNRTTLGSGPIEDMTLEEVRALPIRGASPDNPETGRVPTLDEAMRLADELDLAVYLDLKTSRWEPVLDVLRDTNTLDRTLMREDVDRLLLMKQAEPDLWCLAPVATPEEAIAARDLFDDLTIVELVQAAVNPRATLAIRDLGLKVQQDVIAGGDVLFIATGRTSGWATFVDAGVMLLQSDRPVELGAFLLGSD